MGKKFKGFLNKEYVGSIEEVNKHSDQFYKDFSLYIYDKVQVRKEYTKLSRFIDLLKISDVYITDMGDILNLKYDSLLDWILILNVDEEINNKINRMRNELKLLQNIKSEYLYDSSSKLHDFIQKCNYLFNNEYLKQNISNIENIISITSYYYKQIDDVEINLLNKQNENPDLKFYDFYFFEIVKMWKFSDAKISKNNDGKIYVNNINDISNAFVVTRNLNKDNRNLARNLSLSKKMGSHRIDDYLIGLGEELFLGLDESDKKVYLRLDLLKNTMLYDITILRWVECLRSLRKSVIYKYEKYRKCFFNINELNIEDVETIQIAKILSFHNDFLDTPFLVLDKEIFVYAPALIIGDIVHYLNIAIKYSRDKSIQNMRGNNFENTIGRLLDYHGNDFCKAEEDVYGNTIKLIYTENSRQHEFDLIASDDDERVVQIECKTFMDPFSYRDYRIGIDKMFSGKKNNGYLETDFMHFESLKNNGHNVIINNIKNHSDISKNKGVSTYFNKPRNWNDMYMMFISNYIFPSRMVKNWSNKYGINFVHWFEFNRLIKNIPLDKDWFIVNGVRVLNSEIETNITDKFNRNNIKEISDGQYISELVNHRSQKCKLKFNEREWIPGVFVKCYE